MERSARREQVLACAIGIFSRKGYHATTVSDIIDEAGVARGTFYLYFKSKRAIFDELLDDFLQQILQQLRRVSVVDGGPSPLEQMRGNVERILGVLLCNQAMARILLHEAVGLDADFDHKLEEFYGRLVSLTEGALRLGQQMGLVTACDVSVAARCVLGSMKEVANSILRGDQRPPSQSWLAEEVLKVLFGGLFVDPAHGNFGGLGGVVDSNEGREEP
jgi:AcrR family transcriptional regulator